MVQLIPATKDEAVAYFTRLTKATDPVLAEQARVELLKFDPSEPRAADSGEWTAGSQGDDTSGNRTRVSETPQRRARERRTRDAQQRVDDESQRGEVEGRLSAVREPGEGKNNARADARAKYKIPSGRKFTRLSPARQHAAHQVMDASAATRRLQARQARIRVHVDALQKELARPNVTERNRGKLQAQLDRYTTRVAALAQQLSQARTMLDAGVNGWSGGKAEKGATVPDLTKRASYPGQRFRHGWVPVTASMEELPDKLGLNTSPEKQATYFASDRVASHHGHPVDINIHQWDNSDDVAIDVNTHPPTRISHYIDDPSLGESAGQPFDIGYTGAELDHKGAARAADHLRDLVTIGRSGHKAGPASGPKSKHQKAAELLDHWMSEGDTNPGDKIFDSGGNYELPLTYKDLRDMLAAHIPPPSPDEKRLTRKVKRVDPDSDSGDLFMRLDTSGDQPVIQITGRERESTPWDPTGSDAHQTSHLTLDQAEELALKLDQYAQAVVPKE